MASTKIPVPHHSMFGGIDRSKPPMYVPETSWWTQFNMRRTTDLGLQQVDRKEKTMTLDTACPQTAIVLVPRARQRRHSIFIICDKVLECKSEFASTELPLVGPDGEVASAAGDMDITGDYRRWAFTTFEGRTYFTNLTTPIHVITPHPYVARLGFQNVLTSPTTVYPAAQYIETFFDHLVVANVNFNGTFPNRIQWSDLRKFDQWTPKKSSEADFYDILESSNTVHLGITGLQRFGEYLVAYTGSGIWISPYVGLPGVMRWSERVKGVGNDFPYAVVAVDRYHFFISERWRNFALFDGTDTPQPIGDNIRDLFFDDLNEEPELRYRTWGYVNFNQMEVVWAYVSKSSAGPFDREVVYNLRDRTWYSRSCEDVHAYAPAARPFFTIDELQGSIDGLSGTINGLGAATTLPDFWTDGTGSLLVEMNTNNENTLPQPLPYLETGDFIYGNLPDVKEVESLIIQASLGTAVGVDVFVSSRKHLDDEIVWQPVQQMWHPNSNEGRISPRIFGRIIRYRFVPRKDNNPQVTGVLKFGWQTFIEEVYNAKQVEK